MPKHFIPLESDPAILFEVGAALGIDASRTQLVDVLSPELLDLVPSPVYAVILLLPEEGTTSLGRKPLPQSDELLYAKQTIGDACGTMAVLHAALNSPVPIKPDTELARFRKECRGRSADQCALILEESEPLETAHKAAAVKGQTVAPTHGESVGFGYIALCESRGHIIEFAGWKGGSIDHGEIKQDLLRESCRVMKEYQEVYPDAYGFSLMALCGVRA